MRESGMEKYLVCIILQILFCISSISLSAAGTSRLSDEEGVAKDGNSVVQDRINTADLVIEFKTARAGLSFSAAQKIDAYIDKTLEDDPRHVFYISGVVGKRISDASYKKTISVVRKYLKQRHGISYGRIVVKSPIACFPNDTLRTGYVFFEDK